MGYVNSLPLSGWQLSRQQDDAHVCSGLEYASQCSTCFVRQVSGAYRASRMMLMCECLAVRYSRSLYGTEAQHELPCMLTLRSLFGAVQTPSLRA